MKIFRGEILNSGFWPAHSLRGRWYVKKHYAFRPYRCACCKKRLWFEFVISDYVDMAFGAYPRRVATYIPKHAIKEKLAGRKL